MGAAVLALGASAQAQLTGNLLLRQGSFTNFRAVNQVMNDNPSFSTGMGSLVTTAQAWNISNIQTLQVAASGPNTWWTNVTTATLNVSRQLGVVPDPSIDPTVATNTGPAVVYSGTVNVVLDLPQSNANGANQSFRMTALTSGISALQGLAAGNYVFSLVANAPIFTVGQTFTAGSNVPGVVSDWTRNPGGGFGLGGIPNNSQWITMTAGFPPSGPNANWAIGINGSPVPEPASMTAMGLGALALLRRRKSKKA